MRFALIALVLASPAFADPDRVHETATRLFDALPDVVVRADLEAACGSGARSHPHIAYCASGNVIYTTPDFAARAQSGYEMAHVLGHAIQVRHGVADVALREIRNRRAEEDSLRSMVTRQVECVAGVLTAIALLPATDFSAFASEPFTDAHWGREPIDNGPRVSIGTQARAQWYDIGYTNQDFAACTVEEMSSDLIVRALRDGASEASQLTD